MILTIARLIVAALLMLPLVAAEGATVEPRGGITETCDAAQGGDCTTPSELRGP